MRNLLSCGPTAFPTAGVKAGIYLAPRGVSNTWNLHSVGDSFPLYDRLIENMILFEGVDPNRVYLLGFSAGGDGVYQVSPRMADRFAAACMSAGHHNNVDPVNLYNLPFLMQMGELDTAYGRNKAVVQYGMRLDALQKQYPGGYVHDVFLHAECGHGFGDSRTIIADPAAWLRNGDRTTKTEDTSAIRWLSRHTRNPLPSHIVWNSVTWAGRSGVEEEGKGLWLSTARGRQFYWLDLTRGDMAGLIAARLNKPTNTVIIEHSAKSLRVLLSGEMLDLSKPVNVRIGDRERAVTLTPNLKTLVQTLADRGDPNYMFEADIMIEDLL